MNRIMKASNNGLLLVLASAMLCRPASLFGQEVASTNNQQTASAPSSSDFEVKLTEKGVLVRRKGTEEWLQVEHLGDPIAVGQLDATQKIYVVTKAVKAPKVKHAEDPEYPRVGGRLWGECRVRLHMVVDDQGIVRQPVVDVSPKSEFAKSALTAVSKWSFEPAKLGKQPVAVLITVEVQFKSY